MFCLINDNKIIATSNVQVSEEWVDVKEDFVYSLVENKFIPKDNINIVAEEKAIVEENAKATKEEQIAQLKAELASYDYIGTKIAMGVATKEEYADKIAYTETLRAKINELQN